MMIFFIRRGASKERTLAEWDDLVSIRSQTSVCYARGKEKGFMLGQSWGAARQDQYNK